MVSFGDSSDDEDPEERIARLRRMSLRMNPPDNELPGVIPVSLVLGRTANVVVALTSAQVFSTGISLSITARLRDSEGDHRLFQEVHGHSRGGDQEPQLLLGVGFADGRTATNLSGRLAHMLTESDDDSPLLVSGSGGGDERKVDVSFWLWPLPSQGDLTLVCAWPSRGIAETHTVLPAEAIATASAAVQELWPWQPPTEHEPPPPTAPTNLPDGWFKNSLGDR